MLIETAVRLSLGVNICLFIAVETEPNPQTLNLNPKP
jgi:hypothetical protein